MQVAPSLPKKARIYSQMADTFFKLGNNWTSNAPFRDSVMAATDSVE
jgi:hypothetical protein